MAKPHARAVIGALWLVGMSCLPGMMAVAEEHATFEQLYGEILARYWRPALRIHGIETTAFDYAQMKRDAEAPGSLFARTVEALAKTDPSRLQGADAAKALWLNAYNFGAMRLIVEHYPVDSIRSMKISLLKYPWSKKAIRVAGKSYSLTQIEKDVLLARFDDPRIVFAVSCAAVSCPDRTSEPFTAPRLDAQLDDTIRTFFRNPYKGLRLDRDTGTLTLSWILKQDSHLFPEERGGIIGFMLPYLDQELQDWLRTHPLEIRYFEHDWTLNDVALADRTPETR